MRKKKLLAIAVCGVVMSCSVEAQVQVDPSGNYRLNPTAPGPRSFTLGDAYTTAGGSLLNVRGDLLPVPNQTGEVFRTTGPNGVDVHWRLFKDAMNMEIGNLFALNADENFHIDAVSGDIRFWTFESSLVGSLQRARLKRAGAITIGSYFPNCRKCSAPRELASC